MDADERAKWKRQYKRATNMSSSDLVKWRGSECFSAYLDRTSDPQKRRRKLNRNKILQERLENGTEWDKRHYQWAKDAVLFIRRMKGVSAGSPVQHGCPSKKTCSLLTWAYDPGTSGWK